MILHQTLAAAPTLCDEFLGTSLRRVFHVRDRLALRGEPSDRTIDETVRVLAQVLLGDIGQSTFEARPKGGSA